MSRRSAYVQQQVSAAPVRKGQASISTYSSRLRLGNTALLVPQGPLTTTTGTRGASKRNYAEVDDDDDRDGAEDGEHAQVIKSRPAMMTKHIYPTEEQLEEAAEQPEVLIPIRINLDLGTYRLSDFFLWNLSENLITPEQFSAIMCTDLDIPTHIYAPQIANAIKTQIEEYAPVASIDLPPGIQNVIVHLSLHLAKHLYEDKFEWDLAGGDPTAMLTGLTPEMFARTIVADMGLTGEFYPAIAHAIYEVLIRLKKEACEGHLPTEVDNDAAYNAEAGWRIEHGEGLGDDWAPSVEELTQEEIERREVERERNIRRLRRETAKFGESVADRAIAVAEMSGLLNTKKRRRKTALY
ncbi:uncharacterized protein V1516DRAFT_627626 [Lipomyces oligophaga]|uniref:uncharacterized protein n=1 Tax=Lipomyces oligophaga TaxID=45792 RepID=UPI0034D0209C